MRSLLCSLRPALAAATLLALAAPPARSQTTTVTACATDVAGGGTNLATALTVGGRIEFGCGAGEVIIRITKEHRIDRPVDIDGAGRITLDGAGATSMFSIPGEQTVLTLSRLAMRGGVVAGFVKSAGGVASGSGTLILRQVRTSASQEPYDVARLIAAERSVFSGNTGAWVIRAASVHLAAVELADNAGSPLADSEQSFAGERRAILDEVTSYGNRRPLVWSGPIEIRRSRFVASGDPGGDGGALSLAGESVIESSEFTNNRARQGGAIWMRGGSLQLRRGTFEGNRAESYGGAIAAASAGAAIQLDLRYSKFRSNAARDGGAISLQATPSLAVNRLSGGPLLFAGNSAADRGGALYAHLGRVELTRAVFVGNRAGGAGGAIVGGRTTSEVLLLGNALLVRNEAPTGGGFIGSQIDLRSSTLAENSGGGLVAEALLPFAAPGRSGEIRLVNTVLAHNAGGNCRLLTDSVRLVDAGHNLQYPARDCGPTIASVDPFLDSFFVPRPGSPARGAGDDAVCRRDLLVGGRDVFGGDRPAGGGPCAIGAVENDLERRALALLQEARELPRAVRDFLHFVGVLRRDSESREEGGGR